MAKKPIKETKYCTLLSQSIIVDEEYTYALEKIIVKEQGNREELALVFTNLMRSMV